MHGHQVADVVANVSSTDPVSWRSNHSFQPPARAISLPSVGVQPYPKRFAMCRSIDPASRVLVYATGVYVGTAALAAVGRAISAAVAPPTTAALVTRRRVSLLDPVSAGSVIHYRPACPDRARRARWRQPFAPGPPNP